MATDDGTPTGIVYDDPMDKFDSIDSIVRKMQSDTQKKQQDYNDLIRQAATRNTSITPTQGFALTALAALPLIAGKFLSGRTRGATALDAGAIGQQGVQSYLGGIEEDDKLRRAGLEQQARTAAGDLNIARSQEAALPGMFLRNKLEQQQMGQRQANELALIKERAKQERQAAGQTEAGLKVLEALKAGQKPDPVLWGQMSANEQLGANRYLTASSGAERADREAQRFAAVSDLPDAEPLPGAAPLVGTDRKDIQAKRSSFIQLQEGAKTLTDGIKSNDPQKARTGYSMMAIAMGGPGMANAGAALSKTEVGRKLGGIPDVIEGGDLSGTAFQRAIGIDPEQLAKETVNMWRNALDTEVKLNYKRDAFKAIPDAFAQGGEDKEARKARLRAMLGGGAK